MSIESHETKKIVIQDDLKHVINLVLSCCLCKKTLPCKKEKEGSET